jgi:hypothetical protein
MADEAVRLIGSGRTEVQFLEPAGLVSTERSARGRRPRARQLLAFPGVAARISMRRVGGLDRATASRLLTEIPTAASSRIATRVGLTRTAPNQAK